MNYAGFSVDDFILDEAFQQWVKQPNPQNDTFWADFLQNHPQKKEIIQEARRIILAFDFKRVDPLPHEYEEVLNRILKPQPQVKKSVILHRGYLAIAATVALLICIGFVLLYISRPTEINYTTQSCETKKITLEDGSLVHINANSTLRLYKNWNKNAPREVWLEGEAYFQVKKSPNSHQKFIVHTQDLDVEVLGTKFNVQDRRGITQVLLNSGKVKLNIHHASLNKQITMKPGELIEFSRPDRKISQKTIQKDIYSTWKENKLVFDDVTLLEVAQRIEDHFGYKVTFKNPHLAKLRFTGATPAQNLDILLKVLEGSFGFKIQKLKQEILIQE